MAPADDSLITSFKALGLTQSKATEAAKNPKSAAELAHLIDTYKLSSLDEKRAVLFAALSGQIVKLGGISEDGKAFAVKKIFGGQLTSVDQVTGVLKLIDRSVYSFSNN